ncbi:ATP-binding cassette domain-containing protein [Halobacteriovorax sp. HLS]|uniref:ATP-binding cassette domain-containing protein n=1 Tax=Halobacteriovorax sp. HLS TaxID=2234000 RepID=UPI000FDA24DC|nr:ATP-binding cassette domain-containing protein [Halobacteriovorax sp. HLS]
MKNKILSCQNLSIGYNSPLRSNLSFDILEGEMTFLQGKNGTGKSTLIKTILSEVKQLDGQINWSVTKEQVSYLPQLTNTEAHFSYTIREILEIYGVSKKYYDFFTADQLSQSWTKSSGGEKQKTMILTKVKENSKLLILDEPFNHLDSDSVDMIKQLLSSLIKTKIVSSLLLVSHLKISIDNIQTKEIIL